MAKSQLWKESLNINGQWFHQYQRNEQPPMSARNTFFFYVFFHKYIYVLIKNIKYINWKRHYKSGKVWLNINVLSYYFLSIIHSSRQKFPDEFFLLISENNKINKLNKKKKRELEWTYHLQLIHSIDPRCVQTLPNILSQYILYTPLSDQLWYNISVMIGHFIDNNQ